MCRLAFCLSISEAVCIADDCMILLYLIGAHRLCLFSFIGCYWVLFGNVFYVLFFKVDEG